MGKCVSYLAERVQPVKRVCWDFRRAVMTAVAAVTTFVWASAASAQITLPDTGVDVPGHITALVTALGTIAAAAIAAWAAFFVVRKGIRWVTRVG